MSPYKLREMDFNSASKRQRKFDAPIELPSPASGRGDFSIRSTGFAALHFVKRRFIRGNFPVAPFGGEISWKIELN